MLNKLKGLIRIKVTYSVLRNKCIYIIKKAKPQTSDYLSQRFTISSFKTDSWTVLSSIEREIKQKIEKIGKPLKDWDINIYRGILTGYNEAFIIDQETRDKLVAASSKNAEIIRPILRGRDIQKYNADWQNLYIITTFPSLKLDIEKYPEIKNHLLSFGFDRLKQTGEPGARKKTNNKWFEVQDSINYWEDFSKQKIVWKRIGSVLRFSYDNSGAYCLDSSCFATGRDIKFLVGYLNSSISRRELLNNAPKTGTGDVITSVQALEPLLIPKANKEQINEISILVDKCIDAISCKNYIKMKQYECEIDNIIFTIFKLTKDEINFVTQSITDDWI